MAEGYNLPKWAVPKKVLSDPTYFCRSLFQARIEGNLLEQIRSSVNQGLALGNRRFKEEIELLYGRRVQSAKMGRPQKSLI